MSEYVLQVERRTGQMVDMYQKCLSGMEWPDALSALPYIVFRSGGVRAELCGEGAAGNAGSCRDALESDQGDGSSFPR